MDARTRQASVERAGGAVVWRYGALGDLIRLTALLRQLAARWGQPCDVVSDLTAAPEVLRGLDCVGEVVVFGERRLPYALSSQQRALAAWLRPRRHRPHYLIEERRHRVYPWSAATAAERLLVRAGLPHDQLLTLADCPRRPLEHGLEHLWRMGAMDPRGLISPQAPATAPASAFAPLLAVGADELAAAGDWLRAWGWDGGPLVVLQTLARRSNRGLWPLGHWRQLAHALLARRPDALLLLAGSGGERQEVEALAAACGHPRVRSAAGDLPLRRLFAVLALAHSAVSVDTGPAHAAAALGCPLVVLAGRADPRRHRPWGPGERVEVVSAAFPPGEEPANPAEWYARHDMAAVAVPAVVAAWERLRHREPRDRAVVAPAGPPGPAGAPA